MAAGVEVGRGGSDLGHNTEQARGCARDPLHTPPPWCLAKKKRRNQVLFTADRLAKKKNTFAGRDFSFLALRHSTNRHEPLATAPMIDCVFFDAVNYGYDIPEVLAEIFAEIFGERIPCRVWVSGLSLFGRCARGAVQWSTCPTVLPTAAQGAIYLFIIFRFKICMRSSFDVQVCCAAHWDPRCRVARGGAPERAREGAPREPPQVTISAIHLG